MTRITGLRGKYDKLNNQERLKLVANAITRDDPSDLSALRLTAPKRTYIMTDAWLEDRFNALWNISVVFWLAIETLNTERQSLEHKSTIGTILRDDLLKPEYMAIDREAFNLHLFVKGIDQQLQNTFLQFRSAAEAINRLSKDVDLRPEELIAHAPEDVKERLLTAIDNTPESGLPEEYVSLYYDLFAHYWPSRY